MLEKIRESIRRINELSQKKKLKVVSHFDTDGITSAAIFARALAKTEKRFSLEIVKNLNEGIIKTLSDEDVLIFLDLASGSLDYLKDKKTEVFIFDHHKIMSEIPENVFMVNSNLHDERLSSAAICYLFAKEFGAANKDLANLAIIGMIGDLHEKDISRTFEEILKDAEAVIKKGFLIYPSTRPLDRALEYSVSPFIPGVSGSREGVYSLLRDAGLKIKNGRYKALYELDSEEMTRLITAVLLRKTSDLKEEELVGNLFLIKFFNRLEDGRQLSALINSCSRMGRPDIALGFCLGDKESREEAEKVYMTYRQSLASALKYVSEVEKIEGKDYMIINAKDKVKDTIIGTLASIMSHSPLYQEGKVIVALAYNEDKIKVSARIVGRKGRNVGEVLHRAVIAVGGDVGGHPTAAGCIISKEQENVFIDELKRVLEVEVVKV